MVTVISSFHIFSSCLHPYLTFSLIPVLIHSDLTGFDLKNLFTPTAYENNDYAKNVQKQLWKGILGPAYFSPSFLTNLIISIIFIFSPFFKKTFLGRIRLTPFKKILATIDAFSIRAFFPKNTCHLPCKQME